MSLNTRLLNKFHLPSAFPLAGRPIAERIVYGLVLFVLVTVPILFGAVQPQVWPVYAVCSYAAFVVVAWSGLHLRENRWWWAAVGLFLSSTLLQCLPFPESWIAGLSPVRSEWLLQAADLTDMRPFSYSLSYAPVESFGWWGFLLGLALFFCVLCRTFADEGPEPFLKMALWFVFGLALCEAVYGLLQALIPNLGVLWVNRLGYRVGVARGTYINRNHFAGFMEMILPLLFGFALSRVRWGQSVSLKSLLRSERLHQHMLMLLALVLIGLSLLFSMSRAGILGAFLGLMSFFLISVTKIRELPRGIWVMFGIFLVLILLYGFQIGFDAIIGRFLALENGNARLHYWLDSWPLIKTHPCGIGLAAFKTVFPIYDTSLHSELGAATYLHSDVLQLLLEVGWIGFGILALTFTTFMVVMIRRIYRMRPEQSPAHFFIAAGAYGGLMAMSFHSFFDFNFYIPANAVYFVMLMAVVRVATRPLPATAVVPRRRRHGRYLKASGKSLRRVHPA